MHDVFINIIGIIGVGLVLLAYCFLQLRKIDPKAIPFSLINLLGSILILISLLVFWNLASVIIEIAWIGISSYGLFKATQTYFRKRGF